MILNISIFNHAVPVRSIIIKGMLLNLTCLMLLTACGGGDKQTDKDTVVVNNSAMFADVNIGSNTVPNSALHKMLDVTFVKENINDNANESFRLGQVYATRKRNASDAIYWVLPLTNISNQHHCFIQFNDLVFKTADDVELINPKYAFVTGSIGAISTINTNTCLQAGETGYVLGIELDTYTQVSQIDVGYITVSNTESRVVDGKLIPGNYTTDDSWWYVDLKNTGNKAVKQGLIQSYILMDDNTPLSWSFSSKADDALVGDDEVLFGEIRTVKGVLNNTEGIANKLIVITDFDMLTPTATIFKTEFLDEDALTGDDFITDEAYQAYEWARYNQKQNQLKNDVNKVL